MKDNKLTAHIEKPVHEVFNFAITPPNTTHWIPGIIAEETNEWPIQVGTVYKLQNDTGQTFEVIVSDLRPDQLVEWTKDHNYHCRYSFKLLGENSTELTYYEWVDEGVLDEPFPAENLANFKRMVEQNRAQPKASSEFTDIVKIMANTPPVSNEELKHRDKS
jgi:hypothetical protein